MNKYDALEMIGCYHDAKDRDAFSFRCMPDEKKYGKDMALFVGYELETSPSKDDCDRGEFALEALDEIEGYMFMESDCSLDGHGEEGIEFISNPCSLEYHLSMMPNLKRLFRAGLRNGFTSHNNGRCGLHMHIDREYFGGKQDVAIAKLIYIFREHWTEMLKFSRRSRSHVSEWAGEYDDCYSAKYIATHQYNFGRYYFLNLTNENTIEIRLWRGTFRPESFEATLRFTYRLAELARDTSIAEIAKMSWEEILGDNEVIKAYWETVKDRTI